ncbi:MAG: sigma-54-dependent Fis family transcriptional regulator [Acidimicrobiales bacterium]|nr:sigma-54-dependent Fis family transcriptional regulator [Hyphomonadaceae bacterium]RZV42771.1 MAG: sigma-54-dependent Fis family transcriptional regulator [Acidimicrobiales bacterium]
MKKNILVADDDASIRFVISKFLSREGFNVRATDNAHTLQKWVEKGEGDVVLTDVHMEQEDIFNFIPDLKKARADLPIIIMSANTSVMTALKSGKFGVFEYIPKPFDLSEVANTIERALEIGADSDFVVPVPSTPDLNTMIGKSAAMQPVFRGISDFMSGDIPVYISGDVGTGKNLTASLIHSSGARKEQPFLFFDDIQSDADLIENVGRGDLLIDRIEELSANRQNILLRALEKNENRSLAEQFRTISTSNLRLSELLEAKMLRPELLSHLRGGTIHLPPLRERQQDILDLAVFFINENPRIKSKRKFSAKASKLLNASDWAGNVRELKNVVNSIVLQFSDPVISEKIVSTILSEHQAKRVKNVEESEFSDNLRNAGRALLLEAYRSDSDELQVPYAQAIGWIEKPLIEEALKITNGNNVKAAELLGIHRNTLRAKIKSLGITRF